MKEFVSWIKNNFSNVFTVIGIILTIYFSVFYVPNYAEELKLKRVENVNSSLISTIQELIYSNNEVDEYDIQTLIRGKELKYNIKYPYTVEDLLIQTQESFLDNRFIPLNERKQLAEKVDSLRAQISDVSGQVPAKEIVSKELDILQISLSVLGLLAALMGIISAFFKSSKEKQLQAEHDVANKAEEIKLRVREGVAFEQFVEETLKKAYPNLAIRKAFSGGYDFIIERASGEPITVEAKYSETELVPLRVANELIFSALNQEGPVLIVTNAEFTKVALERIKKFNSERENRNNKIYVVTGKNFDELEKKIRSEISKIINGITNG